MIPSALLGAFSWPTSPALSVPRSVASCKLSSWKRISPGTVNNTKEIQTNQNLLSAPEALPLAGDRNRRRAAGLGLAPPRGRDVGAGPRAPRCAAPRPRQEFRTDLNPGLSERPLQKFLRAQGLPWGCSRPDFPKALGAHLVRSAFWKL